MYLDFKLDESYTPSKISVRAGTGAHDLKARGRPPALPCRRWLPHAACGPVLRRACRVLSWVGVRVCMGTRLPCCRAQELRLLELEEPSGWTCVPLGACLAAEGEEGAAPEAYTPLAAFCLQLAVLTNHQNGRDTHVREVRVYGPRPDEAEAALGLPLKLSSPEFAMYGSVR